MKKLFCHLARRCFDPKQTKQGLFSSHLDSCPGCQTFLKQTQAIEEELRSPPSSPDEDICQSIIREIRTTNLPIPAKSVQLRPWLFGAGLTALVTAAAFLISFMKQDVSSEADPISQAPPAEVIEAPPAPTAESPVQSFATLIQQQEFLRRDARKLGAHLRERVILFQQVN